MRAEKNTLSGRQRCDEADQSNMRVCNVLDLASLHATEAFEHPDQPLEDFIDVLLEDRYKVHPTVQALRDLALKCDDNGVEELGYLMYHADLLGIVLHVATPVMTRTSKTSWSFSWGCTQSTWIYADTYEQAWKQGIAWADQCRNEAKPAPKKPRTKAVGHAAT